MYDVTVIMNSYQEEKPLFERALASIHAACPSQVILSTVKGDKCLSWARNVEVVVSDKGHIFRQIEATVEKIKSRWVTYFASNDVMLPHKLGMESGMLNGKKVCYSSFWVGSRVRSFYPYSIEKYLKGSFVSDCAMIETKIFKKYMPFNHKYGNNCYWDLFLRIYEGEGDVFVYNDRPTWRYYERPTSRHIRRLKDPVWHKENMMHKQQLVRDHERILSAH